MGTVLLIIPNLTFGGIQTQVVHLANILKSEGFSPLIIGVGKKSEEFTRYLDSLGIIYEIVKPFRFKRISSILLPVESLIFNYQLRKFSPECIFSYTKALAIRVNICWQITGARASYFMERGGISQYKTSRLSVIKVFAIRNATYFISNSAHAANDISTIVPSVKTKIILNALTKAPTETPTEEFDLKVQNIIEGNKVFLMVANFFPGKRQDLLVEAWKMFRFKNDSWLLLIGQRIKNEISRAIDEEKRIIYMGSSVHVSFWIQKSNFCILATDSEGCPNVVLEYLVNRKYFIGSNVPGISEIIPKEYHSKMLFKNSVLDILDKLNDAYNESFELDYIDDCYRVVIEKYSLESLKKNYMDLLRKVN